MFFWHFKFHDHHAESTFPITVLLIEMFLKRWSCSLSASVSLGCFLLLLTETYGFLLLFIFLVLRRVPTGLDIVYSGSNLVSTESADIDILTDLWRMPGVDMSPDITKHLSTPWTLHWISFISAVYWVHVFQQTVVRLLISQSGIYKYPKKAFLESE